MAKKRIVNNRSDTHYIGEELRIKTFSGHNGRAIESRDFVIEQILDKDMFNIYVCRNKLGGYCETFADIDLVKLLVEREEENGKL